jgi:signal recognition particle subunit SEC65
VRQPNLREIVQAATALGYGPEPTEGAAKPGSPWEKTGYVAIKKPGPKIATLKAITGEIVKLRQKEAQLAEAKQARK